MYRPGSTVWWKILMPLIYTKCCLKRAYGTPKYLKQVFRQWRVAQNGEQREKETREIQPRTIQFFKFLQGSILALFSYYASICAVPASIWMLGISNYRSYALNLFMTRCLGNKSGEWACRNLLLFKSGRELHLNLGLLFTVCVLAYVEGFSKNDRCWTKKHENHLLHRWL